MKVSRSTILPFSELEKDNPYTLFVDDWETPATEYRLRKVGRAKITRKLLKKNLYHMEGVRGYAAYCVRNPVPVTSLRIGRETVMVDDPLQWFGMQDLANHCTGKLMVGGLGLGLLVHALKDNREVTEIHIIEKNPDVIELMTENLPQDPRLKIIPQDVYWCLDHPEECPKYDTVVLDIWWGRASTRIGFEMMIATAKVNCALPSARLMIWGHKDPEINPAVAKEITLCGVPEIL